ncbi:MAG: membrane protein FxsA [Candidatus Mycalebacterium zealandia]|nr:MAG: membrane protein FxsA [Candidatus Mycalebacterium zealandia]
MFSKIIPIFVVVPLIELAILIKLGSVIGTWETVWIVVATAVVGASLARRQGISVLMSIMNDLSGGRKPSETLLDGVMVLVGGALLLTPGLLTDLAGFALLIPQTRAIIKKSVQKRIERKLNIIDISPDG